MELISIQYFYYRCKTIYERSGIIDEWFEKGGVLVIGYDAFRNLAGNIKHEGKFDHSLLNPGPDLVICDEGHVLKNDKTSLNNALSSIRTKRRIILTGTPLQNRLLEYWCMVNFVNPYLLGTRKEFCNRFVNPIKNGGYRDSLEEDIQMMKDRSFVLHKLLDFCVQRLDISVLQPFLPAKFEYVVYIRLSIIQVQLYEVKIEILSLRSYL